MDKTAIQTSVPPPPPTTAVTAAPPKPQTAKPRGAGYWVRKGLTALASLRLTVVLFAMALVIVFAGTLAERDYGLAMVLKTYFRAAFVWIPLDMFTRRWFHMPGSLPFPGGWAIGSALMFNLLAAHLVRFKLSWRRSGIILLHLGIGVLFVGEFIAGLKSLTTEGHLTVKEGQWMNYVENTDSTELAITDPSDPKSDKVVVIPSSLLRPGQTIHDDRLPFDVEVVKYMVNSGYPDDAAPGDDNQATAGDGLTHVAKERPQSRGVDAGTDFPAAYLKFIDKQTHKSLGTYLTSVWWSGSVLPTIDLPDQPQRVKLDGKCYDVSLRLQRTYKPYSVYLIKFVHDRYPGTDIPKNYASTIDMVTPATGEEKHDQVISMNAPLRTHGETFYQSGFLQGEGRHGTVLQVVRNPGWELPYVACGMVLVGMLIHFGMSLYGFLRRRAAV